MAMEGLRAGEEAGRGGPQGASGPKGTACPGPGTRDRPGEATRGRAEVSGAGRSRTESPAGCWASVRGPQRRPSGLRFGRRLPPLQGKEGSGGITCLQVSWFARTHPAHLLGRKNQKGPCSLSPQGGLGQVREGGVQIVLPEAGHTRDVKIHSHQGRGGGGRGSLDSNRNRLLGLRQDKRKKRCQAPHPQTLRLPGGCHACGNKSKHRTHFVFQAGSHPGLQDAPEPNFRTKNSGARTILLPALGSSLGPGPSHGQTKQRRPPNQRWLPALRQPAGKAPPRHCHGPQKAPPRVGLLLHPLPPVLQTHQHVRLQAKPPSPGQ